MTNDLENTLRSLEQATAADAPADRLDAETASLREAWLAFGQVLEAAQPPAQTAIDFPPDKLTISPRPTNLRSAPGEAVRVKGATPHTRFPSRRLLASGLLAASLLVAVAAAWTLYRHSFNGLPSVPSTTEQQASNTHQLAPRAKAPSKGPSTVEVPQWDDSLDEQFQQVNWQMLCVQNNRALKNDAVELFQYQMEQFRESVQTDSL
jgi:hypothetical protein